MKKLILTAAILGLTGGAYAGEAFRTLAAQAPAATAALSVPAPEQAAVSAAEPAGQAYEALAGLFESGQDVQLYELVQQDYPNGYAVDLITADSSGGFKRGGGLINITGYYDLARPATKFAATCTLLGRGYKGSDYDDSIALMKLKPVNSGGAINVEIKRNGSRLILKAANLPEGTGYGLVITE